MGVSLRREGGCVKRPDHVHASECDGTVMLNKRDQRRAGSANPGGPGEFAEHAPSPVGQLDHFSAKSPMSGIFQASNL
jgi:hypothetical protein